MANTRKIKIFDASSMEDDLVYQSELTTTHTNFGFYIQINWLSQIGVGKIKVQSSIDGLSWADYPLSESGYLVYEILLSGSSGTIGIEVTDFFADNFRIIFLKDTDTVSPSGTINGLLTLIRRDSY